MGSQAWRVRRQDGSDSWLCDEYAREDHRRPATFADLNRERVGLFATDAGTVLDSSCDTGISPFSYDYPLDADIYHASLADDCKVPAPSCNAAPKVEKLCDDGRRADGLCTCSHPMSMSGMGDCPNCLAYAEIAEAWELHTVWLAVHAPAGDVDRRAAEDHAEAARKRERDAWMRGIR